MWCSFALPAFRWFLHPNAPLPKFQASLVLRGRGSAEEYSPQGRTDADNRRLGRTPVEFS
jgi:hypothetical protein